MIEKADEWFVLQEILRGFNQSENRGQVLFETFYLL